MSAARARLAELSVRIGGKAASLVIAGESGLPVPPFFALTSTEVEDLANDTVGAERVRERICNGLTELGGGPVAVRSSAQAEDGIHSFAGQLESRIGVSGDRAVLEAVTSVTRSVQSARLESYVTKVNAEAGSVAVFVQRSVSAVVAGAGFSRDPVTFQPEVVVEAVPGEGRSLVGGLVTPTRASFDPDTLEINELERRSDVPIPVLEEAARLTLACERLFGRPQDIEWVWDGHKIWLVQTRRLTGFEEAQVFSDTWSSEVWPGLLKPVVFDVGDIAVNAAWGRIFSAVAGRLEIDWSRMAALAASRAYFNETLLGQVLSRAGLPVNTLEIVMRGQRPCLRQGSIPRLAASMGRLLRFVLGNLRWLSHLEHELPSLAARVTDVTDDVRSCEKPALGACFARLLALLEEASYLSALTTFSMGLRSLSLRVALRAFSAAPTAAMATDSSVWTAPLRDLGEVRQMLAELPTQERAAAESGDLRRIEEVLGRTERGRTVQARMAMLLERWGHIAMVNTDFSAPAWRDEEGMLWRLAAISPLLSRPEAPPRILGTGLIGGRIIQRRSKRLQVFMQARDEVNDVLARTYDAWRLGTQKAGRVLCTEVIQEPTLVYFLRYAEMLAALSGALDEGLGRRAEERAAEYAADADISPPHRLWDLRLPPRRRMSRVDHPHAQVGEVLKGVPASAGIVVGQARVVDHFSDTADVRSGDVLVLDNADIGWTPLLAVASAVITAAGGMLSHAAVVAREFGIPAVLAVEDATLLIPDGARVSVNGSEGTVTLLRGRSTGDDSRTRES